MHNNVLQIHFSLVYINLFWDIYMQACWLFHCIFCKIINFTGYSGHNVHTIIFK